jgi:4-amino-4-deoxy-L-arabinose transferase-like glycosyltransferase
VDHLKYAVPAPHTPQNTLLASSERGILAGILALGVVLRASLLWWFVGQPLYIEDERSYNEIAVSLVQHGSFATASGELTSLRPPLYPAFLAATYAAFGLENYQAARAIQAIISLANAILVYEIAKRVYPGRVALVAAAICCFYPSLVGSAFFLLTETLFAFWVLLICLSLLLFLQNGSLVSLVGTGVTLGLASLTRSVLWLFPPLLAAYLLIVVRGRPLRQRLAIGLVPLLAFLAVIAPWAVRNTRLHRTFTVVDVMGGRNLMMGNYEYTPLYRAWDAISLHGEKSWHGVLAAEYPGYDRLTQGQRDKLAMRRGLQYMLAHPWLTLKRSTVKFFNFWQLDRAIVAGAARGWWGVQSRSTALLLAVLIMGSFTLAVLAAVFGFALRPAQEVRFHWFLLLLLGFTCALHTVVFAHSRYLLPMMPVLFIYTAAALTDLPGIWRNRGQTRFVLAVAIGLILLSSWLVEICVIDLQHVRDMLA